MMSKKSKGVILDYGVGVFEDAKGGLKFQSLMQDYQELQKEADVIRSKLEAGKQRKMVLAAEVRFLRRRYEYLVKTKTSNSLENEKLIEPQHLLKQAKRIQHRLSPIPEAKPKKKQYIGKARDVHSAFPVGQHNRKILHGGKEATQHPSTLVADLNPQKGRLDIRKQTTTQNITTQVPDLNQKERMLANDTALRNITAAFDLNRGDSHSRKEVSLPSRAPIFDLNEISTGDEDLQSNFGVVKFEEVKKSLMRGPNDEVQTELMLSVCRNGGEGGLVWGRGKFRGRILLL